VTIMVQHKQGDGDGGDGGDGAAQARWW